MSSFFTPRETKGNINISSVSESKKKTKISKKEGELNKNEKMKNNFFGKKKNEEEEDEKVMVIDDEDLKKKERKRKNEDQKENISGFTNIYLYMLFM